MNNCDMVNMKWAVLIYSWKVKRTSIDEFLKQKWFKLSIFFEWVLKSSIETCWYSLRQKKVNEKQFNGIWQFSHLSPSGIRAASRSCENNSTRFCPTIEWIRLNYHSDSLIDSPMEQQYSFYDCKIIKIGQENSSWIMLIQFLFVYSFIVS